MSAEREAAAGTRLVLAAQEFYRVRNQSFRVTPWEQIPDESQKNILDAMRAALLVFQPRPGGEARETEPFPGLYGLIADGLPRERIYDSFKSAAPEGREEKGFVADVPELPSEIVTYSTIDDESVRYLNELAKRVLPPATGAE